MAERRKEPPKFWGIVGKAIGNNRFVISANLVFATYQALTGDIAAAMGLLVSSCMFLLFWSLGYIDGYVDGKTDRE